MICFPLNNTTYEANALGAWFGTRTRGVYCADDNLAVLADGEGMYVTLRPGLAWLKRDAFWGAVVLQEESLRLTLEPADGILSRIDTIVLRLDKDENLAAPLVRTGTFSAAPAFFPPVRDAHADEIILATVQIGAGAIAVTQADITDQRLNEEYCGLMRDGVTGIPTQTLHAQWTAFLAQTRQDTADQRQQSEREFAAWFTRMKDQFTEDAVGGLQAQLDDLAGSKADESAVNEALADKADAGHTHDGRYYTETETNNLLAGKAASSHTHTKAQVGLGNVDNTADSAKSVKYATSAGSAVDQTARNAAASAQSTANSANTAAANANSNANNRMPIAGGTFTGDVAAPTDYGTHWHLKNNTVRNAAWGDSGMSVATINFLLK